MFPYRMNSLNGVSLLGGFLMFLYRVSSLMEGRSLGWRLLGVPLQDGLIEWRGRSMDWRLLLFLYRMDSLNGGVAPWIGGFCYVPLQDEFLEWKVAPWIGGLFCVPLQDEFLESRVAPWTGDLLRSGEMIQSSSDDASLLVWQHGWIWY